MTRLTLMLLGKTGHGKSSTGNSIIGCEGFDVSDSSQSYTKYVSACTAQVEGRLVTVIDTPGLYDTDEYDATTETSKATDYIRAGFEMTHNNRVDAFLLVLPYSNRYTREEDAVIRALERTSLDRKLWDRCIVIFTSGNDFIFYRRRFRSPPSFMDWCRSQSGGLEDLLDRVSYRCLLFENLRCTPEEERLQRRSLFREVDNIVYIKGSFKKSDFERLLNKNKSFFSKIASACTIL